MFLADIRRWLAAGAEQLRERRNDVGGRLGKIEGIRGFLLDIDGTLLTDASPIPGVPEAVRRLISSGVPYRITSNITRLSRAAMAERLRSAGMPIESRCILNPSVLARRRVIESGRTRTMLLVAEGTQEDFGEIEQVAERPEWVIVGDLGPEFTRRRLDPAFRSVREGASMLALHMGRCWQDPREGWVLDAGAFVTALEYATGAKAEVVGKPSLEFFRLALQDLGIPANETLVVGDDLDADVGGGSAAGCRTALVRTGKFSGAIDRDSGRPPDLIVDSVAALF